MNKKLVQKLIKNFGILASLEGNDLKQEKIYELVKLSKNENFPVYSTLVLIGVKLQEENISSISDGWVDDQKELEIKELKEEILRLKRIKLIDFPNIDKKWRVAFLATLLSAAVITLALVFRTTHLAEKTELLSLENTVIVEEATNLKQAVNKFSDSTLAQERKIINLSSDYTAVNQNLEQLQNTISEKNKLLSELNVSLKSKEDKLNKQKELLDKITLERETLSSENKFLKNKVGVLEDRILEVRNVKFNVGYSYNPNEKCRDTYLSEGQIFFNAHHSLLIRKLTVVARNSGEADFYLMDNTTKRTTHKKVYLQKGMQTVSLDFEVSRGNDHYLGSNGVKLLALRDCYKFPYTISDVIKLNKSSNEYYPSFFNWVVSVKI